MPRLNFKGKVFVENHHLAVPFHELTPARDKGMSDRASLHDNLIVHGDNLAALKSLLPTYHGKVKCIYIDPPYNTGNEGWAYNDNVNSPLMREWLGQVVDRDDLTRHDKWCCMMLPRLKLLRELLREDGVIFVSIDDNEVHHLRALLDEVFGEENFVATIVWHKMDSPKNTARHLSEDHDYVVLYARDAARWQPHRLPRTEEMLKRYRNPDEDPRGPWLLSDLAARNPYSKGRYPITTPSGKTIEGPPAGSYWRVSEERFWELDNDNRIWWGESGANRPGIKRFLSEVQQGVVPQTIWHWKDAGSTRHSKQELREIFESGPGEDAFVTPKPTRLIRRILRIATDPDSIVLDSFAGSGTTAHAVLAENRQDGGSRRFLLVECEDYADRLTAERIRRVIGGVPSAKEDALKDGLGGTFSYFELGRPMRQESLLDGSHLPSWEKLASYVFFTATGQEFDPAETNRETGFIGHTAAHDVFLIYEPDVEQLKSLALSLPMARALPASPRRKLVFAPTKYLDPEFLHQYRIDFQQLPFQIYEAIERLER
ncbi:MAG: site-specific DNA-methyltransferase [Acidimicrobiaceae bacterium]|nr:site-specific DNA-methyltransferase [Acidimicrobiaceae bacterium]